MNPAELHLKANFSVQPSGATALLLADVLPEGDFVSAYWLRRSGLAANMLSVKFWLPAR